MKVRRRIFRRFHRIIHEKIYNEMNGIFRKSFETDSSGFFYDTARVM